VLPTDQKFCCKTQKPNKKSVGGRILVDFSKKGRKEAEFETGLLPLFFPSESTEKVDFSQTVTVNWLKFFKILIKRGKEFFSLRLNFSLLLPDYLEWSWKHWFCAAKFVVIPP
jgi:hypothetical protein